MASTLETHGDKPLAPPHDPRDSSRPLLRDQVDLLYAQAGTASAFTLANGAILVGVLWDVAAHGPLLAWAALLAGVTGLRYALSRRYRTRPLRKEPELWRDRFVIGAALGGLCWGIVGSWLLPMSSAGHQTLSLIMVAGMSAGALSYQVAVPRAYILYASGALLPTALWLLISGQPVLPVIGVLALILWASLLLTARAIHRTLLESLRLRYVNADLIEDLAESQRQLRSANRRLQGEIAEHTRTEAELRDSFLFLKRIQDNTTNAIYVLDREGHFVHVNHVTSALTAYPRDSLVGRPFLQLFDAETAESVSGQLARALRGETVTQFEAVLTRAEGGIRNVSFNLAPLHEGTQVSAVVGTAEDVTERKRMDRLKSEFLSTVSHELRTPLTSIRGSLGLLHNAPTGIGAEDTQALVGIAYKNTDRLIRLINDLLDIQKLEGGDMRFRYGVHALGELAAHAIEVNHGLAESYDVEFSLDCGDEEELWVHVDRHRFEQVLTNLLSNAAKFSPKGGTVEIRLQRHGERARVSVRDHGPGIAEEFRDQVFKKFAQADASDARREGGTGLGLSICRGIIERLDGEIGFTTEPGAGTTFHVDLPLTERPGAATL